MAAVPGKVLGATWNDDRYIAAAAAAAVGGAAVTAAVPAAAGTAPLPFRVGKEAIDETGTAVAVAIFPGCCCCCAAANRVASCSDLYSDLRCFSVAPAPVAEDDGMREMLGNTLREGEADEEEETAAMAAAAAAGSAAAAATPPACAAAAAAAAAASTSTGAVVVKGAGIGCETGSSPMRIRLAFSASFSHARANRCSACTLVRWGAERHCKDSKKNSYRSLSRFFA